MNLNSEILTLLKSVSEGYQSQLGLLSKDEHLSALEGTILSFLRYNEGLDDPSDIVRLLHLSKGDVSMAVTHLEKAGYLSKTKDPEDKRKQHLALEKPADPFLEKADRMRRLYFAQVFQGFDENDIATFKHLLERISTNVSTHH